MAEIFYILQMRIKNTHQLYYGKGIALALFRIFDRLYVFDHFLNMPSVLLYYKVITRRIILH